MTDYQLNEIDKNLLEEILNNYNIAFIDPNHKFESNLDETEKLTALTKTGVTSFISFYKLNIDFKELNQETQIVLLKNSIVESLLLQAAISYDSVSKNFVDFNSNIILNTELVKAEYGSVISSKALILIQKLHDLVEGDKTCLKIMLFTILYFPNISELNFLKRQSIANLHIKYLNLLHCFMKSKFGIIETDLKFSNYLCDLRELFSLAAVIRFKSTYFIKYS